MNGYHQMSPCIIGLFAEDYGKDPIFNCNQIYTNLESAEGFPHSHHLDPKYMMAPPNLLQADPNLQQVGYQGQGRGQGQGLGRTLGLVYHAFVKFIISVVYWNAVHLHSDDV